MPVKLAILCSADPIKPEALINVVSNGQLMADIKIVINDECGSQPLLLARSSGLYGAYLPRAPFHDNQEGFERRMIEMMNQCEVELVVMAGFKREIGRTLKEAFPGKIVGLDSSLSPEELIKELEGCLRNLYLKLVS